MEGRLSAGRNKPRLSIVSSAAVSPHSSRRLLSAGKRSLGILSVASASHGSFSHVGERSTRRTGMNVSLTGEKDNVGCPLMSGTAYNIRRKEFSFCDSSVTGRRYHRRLLRKFVAAAQALRFAAAMRRVVRRHREWVRRETIEKPRAAFLIQTAWREYKRRRRIAQSAALRKLVPFLRLRIRRIIAAKERSALLLQRVFRSQRDRHFMHWLYGQMKYNKAIHMVRMRLKRYVARRCRLLLAQYRDERVVMVKYCAMAAQAIVREEREEVLRILQSVNVMSVTPVVTRAMLCADMARTIGCTAGDKKELEEFPWTSALHTSEGARQLFDDLFTLKAPPYPIVGGRLAAAPRDLADGSPKAHEKIGGPLSLPTSDGVHSPNSAPCLSHGSVAYSLSHLCALASGGSGGGGENGEAQGPWALGLPSAPRDGVLDAFLELFVRTESIERRALEASVREWRVGVKQHMAWFNVKIQAMQSVPPLFAPLIASITKEWLIRRAAQLFCEEHEARSKILLDYKSTPLLFLDRPVLNFTAEERRRHLVQRVPRETKESNVVFDNPLVSTHRRISFGYTALDETVRDLDRNVCDFPFMTGRSHDLSPLSLKLHSMSPSTADGEFRAQMGSNQSQKSDIWPLSSVERHRSIKLYSPKSVIDQHSPSWRGGSMGFGSAAMTPLPPSALKTEAFMEESPDRDTVSKVGTGSPVQDGSMLRAPSFNDSAVIGRTNSLSTLTAIALEGLPIPLMRHAQQQCDLRPQAPKPEQPEPHEGLLSRESGLDFVWEKNVLPRLPRLMSMTTNPEQRRSTMLPTAPHKQEEEKERMANGVLPRLEDHVSGSPKRQGLRKRASLARRRENSYLPLMSLPGIF